MLIYSSTFFWAVFQVLICGSQIKATPAPTSGDDVAAPLPPPPGPPRVQLCEPVCPEGFDPNGYQCFLVQKEKRNWHHARAKCSELAGAGNGGDLATPFDLRGLAKAASGDMGETSFWLGANDLATEGTWVWNNDAEIYNKRWAANQPEPDPEKNCVWMDTSRAVIVTENILHSGNCGDEFSYVCQSNLIYPTSCH